MKLLICKKKNWIISNNLKDKINKSQAELKEILAAFYTFIAELARHDVDVNSARF